MVVSSNTEPEARLTDRARAVRAESNRLPRDVILLSQFMFPEMNATGQLMTSLSTGLAQRGTTVIAYAAQPSYFGTQRAHAIVQKDGVTIRRLWHTHLGRRSTPARAVDGASFILRLALESLRFKRDAPIIAVTNPPFLPLVGALRRFFFKNPLVVIIHDVYPEIAVQLGTISPNSAVHRLLNTLDRFILSQADSIVVLGRDMEVKVSAKLPPSRRGRIVRIPNWADATQICAIPKVESTTARREQLLSAFVVQYSGNLGRSQCFDTILGAAAHLADTGVLFAIRGEGVKGDSLRAAATNAGLANIRFYSRVEQSELSDALAACDLAIVPLTPGLEGLSVPSKFYGILASGRPVIALMSPDSEVALAVRENDCGRVVDPGNSEELQRVILELRNNPRELSRLGENARKAFDRFYTREIAIESFTAVLSNLANVKSALVRDARLSS